MKKKFKSENIKYEDDFEYIPINEMKNNQKQKDNGDIKKEKQKEKTTIAVTNKNNNNITKKKNKKLFKIIPLGGLEQIGMNITAFEYDNNIVIVDCGIAFPNNAKHPGVESIIPNVKYLIANIQKVKGFFITHGHEDHIGALPHIIKNLNVPIYGTSLTISLIKKKLEEHKLLDFTTCHDVKFGDVIDCNTIKVEFIKTNHSIVDAAALAISTKIGTIIHTGDFKVDFTPVFDDAIDLNRFSKLGEKGVLALLCDSTNAEQIGFTPSERKVGPIIDNLFTQYNKSRIIVSTFASNVDRVQQIVNSAYLHNRKVVLEGRSMISIINTASELGKIDLPKDILIDEDDIKNYKDEDICIICTGSQGENMAALSKMATKTHKKINISKNDVIIFSSHPIPGNERSISNIINALEEQGAEIVMQDTHVSGHARQEEIKLLYSLTKPMYAIPLHGEFKHRLAGAKIAIEMGVLEENTFLLNSGDVLAFDSNKNAQVIDKIDCSPIYIDSYSKEPISDFLINERLKLADSGIVNVIYAIEKETGIFIDATKVMSRGFIKVSESMHIIDDIKNKADSLLEKCSKNGYFCIRDIPTQDIQHKINDYIYMKYKKRPLVVITILPIPTIDY